MESDQEVKLMSYTFIGRKYTTIVSTNDNKAANIDAKRNFDSMRKYWNKNKMANIDAKRNFDSMRRDWNKNKINELENNSFNFRKKREWRNVDIMGIVKSRQIHFWKNRECKERGSW